MAETFLQDYVDPGWALDALALAAWTPEAVVEFKLIRLTDDLKAHAWAAQIPRRLGGDASASDLSLDKQRFHASVALLATMRRNWARLCPGYEPAAINLQRIPQDLRAAGAQTDWETWNFAACIDANDDRAAAVTAALQKGLRKWANQVAWLYTQELDHLVRLSTSRFPVA